MIKSDDERESPAAVAWLNQERETMHRKMLSAVSHDLKTPLASVIGSLEVMERMKDRLSAEKQKELFAVALQEAYRLDAFVTNILDMAKLETGGVKPRFEKTDYKAVIRQCIARLGRKLEHATVQVIDDESGAGLVTDSVLLGRVLVLMLDNAVKYSGDKPVITIGLTRSADQACIEIIDQGKGIPDDRIKDIFCKYTRIAGQDNQIAGTGLGLAICKEIVLLLRGQITVANNDLRGCTFTLRLPLNPQT